MKKMYATCKNLIESNSIRLFLFCVLLSTEIFGQQPGNALKFDGSNDYVSLPNALATAVTFNTNTALTIEYWFRGTDNISAVRIQNSNGFIVAGYGMQHIISTDGGAAGVAIPSSVYDGRWHHIAMTWQKGATNGFKSYVDGKVYAQRDAANVNLPTITSGAFIGSYYGSREFINGSLDEVRIYNVALTQTNIQADMINGASSVPLSLLAHYHFNQGTAGGTNTPITTLRDTSGNARHGTLTNFALTGTASNWVESYAMVRPTATAATNITPTGFTANWSAVNLGTVNNYQLDVSTNPDFTGHISSSPYNSISSTSFSQSVSGLLPGTYYYRAMANKTTVDGQGCNSDVMSVTVPYTGAGNALALDGSNDYVSLPTGAVSTLSNITIEAWFTVNNTNAWQRVFDFGSGTARYLLFSPTAGSNGYSISGLPNFEIYNGSVVQLQHINGNKPLITGKWYHVAITINNATTTGRMYINGELVGENTSMNIKPSDLGVTTQNWLGRSQYADPYLNGKIDEFRIWNLVRTQAEIQAGMKAPVSTSATGLVSYYNFNKGVDALNNAGANVITDLKDSTKTATLNNFSLTGTVSNWVESYAMTIPVANAASAVSTTGFTANWTAPTTGAINNYFVDVSLYNDFSTVITGSPFTVAVGTTSRAITGLSSNTNYYYRIRADKSSVTGQGAVSSTIIARTASAVTPPGNCLALDGSNDYAIIPVATGINNQFANNRITVETWVYLKSLSAMPSLITENYGGNGGTNIKYSIYLYNGILYGGFHPGSWVQAQYNGPLLALNRWIHVASTYDQIQIKLYIDGTLVATTPASNALPPGNEDWRIGCRWDLIETINGSMDEVRIYNEALTQNQIKADMRDTTSALPGNLVAYYNFDQGTAAGTNTGLTILTDRSSSANYNAYLQNFALSGTNSNYVSSYAMTLPVATPASSINANGFTANWTAQIHGTVDNYFLDVSTTTDFTAPITGSPFSVVSTIFTKVITGLLPGTYYYRVRANNTTLANQGAASNTMSILVPYSPPGNALAFDGSGDVVVTQIATSYIDNFTMETWVNPSILTGDWQTIFAYGFDNAQYGNGVALYIHPSNGTLHILYPAVNFVDLGVKIDLNRWSHVAMTRRLGVVTIYLNGVQLAITGINNPNGITGEIRMGGHTGIRFLNGKMDEFRFWSPARTQVQILEGMRNSIAANSTGLLVYYKFDQGVRDANNTTTNFVLDQTSNGNNGSMFYFSLTGTTSNWVESYAMVVPVATAVTNITPSSFTANWTAPLIGTTNNYLVDVSTIEDFTAPISGSPFGVASTVFTRTITGLLGGPYFYRIRSHKTNLTGQGGVSNTIAVNVPYTPPGNALAFDGVDDRAKLDGNNVGNFGTSNFTIELWMKSSATAGYLVAKRENCSHGSFFQISHSNTIHADLDQDGNGTNYNWLQTTNTKPVNDGRWHHIAVVREGLNVKIYIDGVVEGSSNTAGVTSISNGNPIDIGNRYCHNLPFNGSMDELRIWNSARTMQQIQDNMDTMVSVASANLQAYYKFDMGVGGLINYGRTILVDATANSNNGKLLDFSLEALNTNYVESYATVVPTQNAPTNITPSGFTLNWNAPPYGVVTNYLVDVSLSSNFTAPIYGSPFSVFGTTLPLSSLASSSFYCRVRANRASSSVTGEGAPSNVNLIDLKYVQPGNALQFDGSDDYGTIPKNITGNFTIEYLLKTTQTGTGLRGIVDNIAAIANFQNGISNGKIYYIIGSGGDVRINSATTVNNGQWYHVAITRNQSTGLMRLYINGSLEVSAYGGTGLLPASSTISLGTLNTYGGNSTYATNMAIDELRIWNVERTPTDITNYFRDTVNRNSTNLVDYYRFDQGIGGANNTGVTTLKDIAGTDNGGTITNFSLSGTSSNWVNSFGISVNAPSGLTASDNVCGRIDLSWTNPSSPTSSCDLSTNCTSSNFKQYVYADDSLVAILPFSSSTVSLNVNGYSLNKRLIRGINYRFKVHTVYVPDIFNYIKFSSPTNIAIGKFKPNPETPSGFTASVNKCDGSIDLSWTWQGTNPNGFVITRSLDSAQRNSVLNTELPGTQRSYTTSGLQRGQLNYYRIYAKNDCYSSTAPDSMIAGLSDTIFVVGGISPMAPAPPSNVRLFADSISNIITIRWNDNSDNEEKFGVERSSVGLLTSIFDVNPNDTVYNDDQAGGCIVYNYKVRAYSACAINGMVSTETNQTRLTPNLNITFDPISDTTIYKLKCSKGYYSDHVELNWNNRNSGKLNTIRIYRKVANSTNDSALIASVQSGTGLYIDNTCVAGIMYKYFLVGELQCGGITLYSNMTYDIGFRSPTGNVSGTVTYMGGVAAKNVRVLAQNTSFNKGGGMAFDGVNDYLVIPHKASQNPMANNALTIEAWFKPIIQNTFVIVSKRNLASGGYSLLYNSNTNKLIFTIANGTDSQTVAVDSPFTTFTSYSQITAAYGSDSIRIYINGLEKKTVRTTIAYLGAPSQPLYLGGSPSLGIYGKGNMDEVRLWKISKTKAQIVNDFNRKIESNNGNLMLYMNFDDRFDGLTETYDQSNLNLVFNQNHAKLINGAVFTDSIPTNSQLALASYTDINGNYLIENMRYNGTGQNYSIVPSLNTHAFLPANRVIFVGSSSQSLSNIDFIDNSSFEFVGRVTYSGTTCPATGALVQVDGQFSVQNGQIVTVNDSGKFVTQVPIGNHVITLYQNNHTFSQGRFPPIGLYNFESPVSANFVDSTFLTVVGRVAGGNRELNKKPGLRRSINNIGRAQFSFNSVGQSGITGCFTRSVVTNDSTGEYSIQLLPLRYTINNLRLVNNSDPTLLTNSAFGNPNLLDLTTIPLVTNLLDTFFSPSLTRIDSVSFHKQLDFKYYSTPQIFVTDTNTAFKSLVNNFIGQQSLSINDTTSISIKNNELGYPVFQQARSYISVVKVVECYTNIDKPSTDSTRYDIVPVSGTLRFNNGLALVNDSTQEAKIYNGIFVYAFRGGVPNQLRNSINPQFSYTRTMQIEFVPELGATVNYLPNQNDMVSKYYRAYVFGFRPGGSNFTSQGPSLVEYVLRDPPGSASSAQKIKETTHTENETYSFSNSMSTNLSNVFNAGVKTNIIMMAGLLVYAGTTTEFEVYNNITLGIKKNLTWSDESEMITTTTNTRTIATGSDPGSVGAGADIYYGNAMNMIFGNADEIVLIDTASCAILDAVTGVPVCIGNEVNGHKIGKKNAFYIAPAGIATTFAYTQNEILKLIIPNLEKLRNQLFTNNNLNIRGQRKYTAVFNNQSDPLYARKLGSNNDDPIWQGNRSTSTPYDCEAKDTSGVSYIFHGDTQFETDSVRFFNNQIRLWKRAIADNEKEKYKAINNSGTQPVSGGSNISIGKASLTQDYSSSRTKISSTPFEWSFGTDLSWKTGFEAFGMGMAFTGTIGFDHKVKESTIKTDDNKNTFSYILKDGDDGDLISVDILNATDGGGNIFKLRAGSTACPYEGSVKSLFYDPNNDTITSSTLLDNGFEIQTATAQNDVPLISVDKKNYFNVPASDEAIFVLELGNLSEAQQDRTYSLRVNQATNPYGAILKIDGLDPNRNFYVPYGTTIQKTLTVKRGPVHYDYNGIQLILKSSCDDNIFDTVSINARFLPTCTSVNLKSPDDRWILNSSYLDTLPVLIGGYNYNWGGFKNLQFQYKPGGTNTWYTEKTYYKDTPDVNVKIPIGDPNIFYPFNFRNLPDGNYELRAVSECIALGYPNIRLNSGVMKGLVDRLNPHPIGSPSPSDGILSPSDDISIQFNEDIEQSTLSLSNFEIKGVLNQSDLKSNTSLYFDGNGDYLDVTQALDLKRKSFTIEFWHKRGAIGNQVLVAQGADTSSDFEIGFTPDDKFYFEVNNEIVKSNLPVTDTASYHYFAVSYNAETQTAELFQDGFVINIGNNRIFNPYEGGGKFYIGKAAVNTPRYAKGNLYELRIWDIARTLVDVNQTKSKLLSGTEADLLANWRMDEATGNTVKDYARFRNAFIVGAQWFLSPMGKSYAFNGNGDFITIPSTHFGISKDMDLTIEFWFKGINQFGKGLLSNGKGLTTSSNPELKMSIETDSIGRIVVKSNGKVFVATIKNYFDGTWHHFSLVLRRNSSLSSYIDANLQYSMPASAIEQLGGSKFWFGAKGWNDIGNLDYDSTSNYFIGQLDDLRIWNSARLLEQLKRDMNTRLMGNELGLVVYIPFEDYQEVLGFPVLNASDRDMTSTTRMITPFGNVASSNESPTLKLPSAAQSINFTYGVNGDKIVITPTTAYKYIENVTLNITVNNIQDKNGNEMGSPKTWIAYVNKNQVKWQDHLRVFNKAPGVSLSFIATIVNTGGELKQYTIGNLPAWIKASTLSGAIDPNSTVNITFTFDQTMNIGKHEEDITLTTDFGFPDKLLVKLNINAVAPNWLVNPANYSKNMSIVGQIRINNVVSANTDDLLGAFVNNLCRGVGKVQYFEQLDKYLIFMDVYGNTENEAIEFRIWNSATGKTHVQVDPSLNFVSNSLVGSVASPQIFNALDKVQQHILLSPGWNWISFNLLMTDSANLNQLFNKLKPANGNLIKNNTQMAVYDSTNGWSGSLAVNSAGIKPEASYLFNVKQYDTLEIRGVEANPLLRTINLTTGWNYLGFVSQRNISTKEALAGYTASQNDLIKGQTSFAVYDTILSWVGSLTTMIPNIGYMYKAATSGSFNYPRQSMFGKNGIEVTELTSNYWNFDPHMFSSNMSVVGKLEVCGTTEKSEKWLLGAFVNNELRGFAKLHSTQSKPAYFLSVAGSEKDNVSFKLLDESTGEVYDLKETMVYKTDALSGSLAQPVVFNASGKTPCEAGRLISSTFSKVYPVPFAESLTIELNLAQVDKVTVKAFGITGNEIAIISSEMFNKGTYHINWEAPNLPTGIYIIEIEKGGEKIRHKVVKQQ